MEEVEIRLLGPIEVVIDGSEVDVGGERQRLLLARLALSVGRPVAVDELLDLLWPDELPDRALGNLQSYVSRLRRRIGRDLVVKDPGGYRLAVPPRWVDATRAEETLTEASQAGEADRVDILAAAAALWRGPVLAEFSDHLGLMAEARRLENLRLRVIAEWAGAALRTGAADEVLDLLEAEVSRDPTNEQLQLLRIEALGRIGRTAEALRAAHGFRVVLGEETGLDPGSAFAELERRLLEGGFDGGSSVGSSVGSRPIRYAPTDTFFGRDEELGRLDSMTEGPGLVSIVGPGGMGKTRLLQHHLDSVAAGRPAALVRLAPLAPGSDVSGAVENALGLRTASAAPAEAVADRLEPRALLALDNCEHVRESVSDFVSSLLARRDDVTVVTTSRQRLDLPGETLFELTPLTPEAQVDLFVDRARRARPDFEPDVASTAMIEQIVAATEGLPLPIELAAARERVLGVVKLAGRLRAVGPSPVEAGDPQSPLSLETSVRWSYDLLPADGRRLFPRLCLVPGDFDLSLAESVVDDDVVSGLAALVDASLIQVDHGVSGPRFRILSLVRQHGAGFLKPEGRTDTWNRLTSWVTALIAGARADQDARRFGPNQRLDHNRELIRAVIGRLAASGDHETAALLAVDTSVVVTDDPDADWLSWLASFERASRSADGEAGGLWALVAATASWISGDTVEADESLQVARSSLGPGHPRRWYLELLSLANSMWAGQASRIDEPVLSLYSDPTAPDFLRATGLCAAALRYQYTGQAARAHHWLEHDPELLDRIGTVDGFVPFTRAELAAAEDPEDALDLLDTARRLCAAAGHEYNRTVAAVARLAVLVRMGEAEQAVTAARELLDECRRAGMWPQVWIVVRLISELLVSEGGHRQAALLLAAADADPAGPDTTGDDAGRLVDLHGRIVAVIGSDEAAAAASAGRSLGRNDILERATAALDEVI